MHEDHDISRRARRKDTVSAEDLSILLQWHWKYGSLIFPTQPRRCELSLLLWSSFTGSRPATQVANDNAASNKSWESSADNLSGSTLADDSDGDTLVGGREKSNSDTTASTICLAWRSTNRSTSYCGRARTLIQPTRPRNRVI